MSRVLNLIPNCHATSCASCMLFRLLVSASGRQNPKVLCPPRAFEHKAAVTLESSPPDIPTTRCLAPILSECVLRNRTILSTVSSGSPTENGLAPDLERIVVPRVGWIKPEWSRDRSVIDALRTPI